MEFKRVLDLANETLIAALCAAWDASPEGVDARKRAETPITVREAAILAKLHGLRLEDILSS